ncbi:hypothetical protein KBD59_05680 [Candidatus Gracilibacteria bacterium]|nr:hypothetical protein [Candidatus Gracilibacteria bacterium]
MEDRSRAILNAIIREFIETAEPVGSKTIVYSYKFELSPATIRNEMAELEDAGFIFQPHTSAGRIPTDTGYRLYVDSLADYAEAEKIAERNLQRVLAANKVAKARERIYDIVSILSQATENVSFATTPDNPHAFFLGFSNVLRQPEFSRDPMRASQVMEVLEDTDNFVKTLEQLEIKDDDVKIYIGSENILPQIHSCGLILCRYEIGGFKGYLGLLGPTRMRYPYNVAIVRKVKNLI